MGRGRPYHGATSDGGAGEFVFFNPLQGTNSGGAGEASGERAGEGVSVAPAVYVPAGSAPPEATDTAAGDADTRRRFASQRSPPPPPPPLPPTNLEQRNAAPTPALPGSVAVPLLPAAESAAAGSMRATHPPTPLPPDWLLLPPPPPPPRVPALTPQLSASVSLGGSALTPQLSAPVPLRSGIPAPHLLSPAPPWTPQPGAAAAGGLILRSSVAPHVEPALAPQSASIALPKASLPAPIINAFVVHNPILRSLSAPLPAGAVGRGSAAKAASLAGRFAEATSGSNAPFP